MKTYTGYRFGSDPSDRVTVMVHQGKERWPLPKCEHIRHHGDFNWGYGGSGPAQLALALVADVMGPEYARPAIYQLFKIRCVACMPCEGWNLLEGEIRHHVGQIQTYLRKRKGTT